MTDDQFRELCNTFGFAPSRALREMLDKAMEQERESCAKVCESKMPNPVQNWADAQIVNELRDCASTIRARKDKQ
jgi:hypothetical protein